MILLAASCANPVLAQSGDELPEELRDDIRELLRLTDAERMTAQMIEYLVQEWQDQYPDMPGEFWVKFGQEFRPEEFIELAIPVYARYLSHADIVVLLNFFHSPVGRTYVAAQGPIQQDLVQVGEVWSREVAARFVDRMKQQQQQN